MEEINAEVLVKSEKASPKRKIRLIKAISILSVITLIVSFIIDYLGYYKKGQKFGIITVYIASDLGESIWTDTNMSYAELCEAAYTKLSHRTFDVVINGVRIDGSDNRKNEEALRSSFAEVMHSAGYTRYNSSEVANWFKYTNFAEYFFEYYWITVLPICCYVVFICSIAFLILVNREAKKELIVYEDSVLCKTNHKKSKQLTFDDISSVDIKKHTLTIIGTHTKFKIRNITNSENISSTIIEKKKSSQNSSNISNVSNADELKKYKELLDSGVISQEEFEAKKKQVLGL